MTVKKSKYIFILIGLVLSVGVLSLSWLLVTSLFQGLPNTLSDDRNTLSEISLVGAVQSDLKKRFGEPDNIEELVRTEEHVFGPIEDLWYKIKMGEKIVTWKYQTVDGWKELYFLNNSDEVVGEFYWYNELDKNPVY